MTKAERNIDFIRLVPRLSIKVQISTFNTFLETLLGYFYLVL